MSSTALLFRTAKLEGFIIHSAYRSSHKQLVAPIRCWASLASNINFFVMISTEFKGKLASPFVT